MHTHLDDGDWRAAIQRFQASVALPSAVEVKGLESIRRALSEDGPSTAEPTEAGPSLDQLLQQRAKEVEAVLTSEHRSLLDDPTSQAAVPLRDAILAGRWSVQQVTEAFLRRAALAQQALGCFADIFFDQARARASELDAQLAQSSSKDAAHMGALFGVPISIKAHLGLTGTGSDRGFVFDVLDPNTVDKILQRETEKPKTDSTRLADSTIALLRRQGPHIQTVTGPVIANLLRHGAVIIGKTTMPQSIMQLDTRSNLHGQTLNPWNLHLSPGGSSGGEAASVASGASLLGVGTDIGGSVRQPASCVGLYGLRGTVGRLTIAGTRSTMPGNEGIFGTMGPFARSLTDLTVLFGVMIEEANQADPYTCPPLPWRGVQMPQRKLNVGVLYDDGFVQPITPIRRALHAAVDKIKASGKVNLITVNPGDLGERGWWMARELYFMENGQLIRALADVTGEPVVPLTEYVLSPPVRDHSAVQSWQLQHDRELFKRAAWKQLFGSGEETLDVLLCPAAALAAPRPQQIRYWGYTSLFNLIDLPGVVFPTGYHVNAQQDKAFEQTTSGAWKPSMGELDEETQHEYLDHRAVFENAPVGLQLIGHRFKEEELLGAIGTLEGILH